MVFGRSTDITRAQSLHGLDTWTLKTTSRQLVATFCALGAQWTTDKQLFYIQTFRVVIADEPKRNGAETPMPASSVMSIVRAALGRLVT